MKGGKNMAMYYRLTTKNVPKEQQEEIGDVVDNFCVELKQKYGAEMGLFNGSVEEALDEYYKNHPAESFNEGK